MPTPIAPLAVRQKVENAILLYLTAQIAACTPTALDTPTVVSLGIRQAVSSLGFPRIVIEGIRAALVENLDGLFDVTLTIFVATKIGELGATDALYQQAANLHTARAGLIDSWLSPHPKTDVSPVMEFLGRGQPANAGALPLAGLIIHALFLSDQQSEQVGEHWTDTLTYSTICQLQPE